MHKTKGRIKTLGDGEYLQQSINISKAEILGFEKWTSSATKTLNYILRLIKPKIRHSISFKSDSGVIRPALGGNVNKGQKIKYSEHLLGMAEAKANILNTQ